MTIVVGGVNTDFGSLQQVECGDVVLDFTQVAKSLSVLINNKLSWESKIDKLHKSFSAQPKMLKRTNFLQVKQLKDIYYKISRTVYLSGRAAL